MSEVVELPVPQNNEVVERLRELLADAEAGNLVAICVVGERTGREIGHCWAGDIDVYRMLGALRSMERRIEENFGA